MEKELHGKAAKTDEEKCHILGMQSNSKNKTIQAENRIWNTTGEREKLTTKMYYIDLVLLEMNENRCSAVCNIQ